jgi:cation:H+ antiporter
VDVVILVLAFVVILLGAELFTNGIEWFGRKLGLAEGAVGSVLAAVGTALPETMIPIVAILFGAGEASRDVAVGAVLGAPFMLATLAMFVTGVAVLIVARKREAGDVMPVDSGVLAHDMGYFALAYAIAIGAAFLPLDVVWLKWVVAAVLLAIYAWYVKGHFEADPSVDATDLAPLRFQRLDPRARRAEPTVPRLRTVNLQVLAALAFIVVGAIFFVGAVEDLATHLGVQEVLLALVIAPIATELPEKFNSIIWVRQGKDTLAMGNITGAMVFQSTIPTVVALLFASSTWHVTPGSTIAFLSAGIAFLSSAAIFIPMARAGRLRGRGLLIGGLFYLLYLGLVVAAVSGLLGPALGSGHPV